MVENKCRVRKTRIRNKNTSDSENTTANKKESKKNVQPKTLSKREGKQLEHKKSKKKTNKRAIKERKEKYELIEGKYFIIPTYMIKHNFETH